MTQTLLSAAASLTAVLIEENAALAALNFPRAAQLVTAKRAATDAFAGAHARLAATGRPEGALRDALGVAGTQLRDLAAENRRLLDRAMATQGRVLDIIAQAVPRASAQAPRYGAAGALIGRNHAPPVAITASA